MKMFKKLQVCALMLTVLFLGACSSQKSGYESLVPVADNDLILAVNVDRLLSKSEILEKMKAIPQLEAELADSSFNEMFKLFRQDPKNSGLDLSSNVYFMGVNNAEDVSIVASMDDVSKFEKFIKSNPELAEVEVAEEAGFKVVKVKSDINLLYNKDLVVLTSVEDYINYISKSEKHISDYKYAKTLQVSNDVAFVSSPKALIEAFENPLLFDRTVANAITGLANSEMYAQYEGLFTAMTLNFEKGEIVLEQINYTETEKAAEYMAKMEKMMNKPSDKYAKAVAKDPYLYALINMNGKLIVEELMTAIKAYLPANSSEQEVQILEKVQTLISYIKGDILFAVSELNISFMGATADMSLLIEGDAKSFYTDLRQLILTSSPNVERSLVKNTEEEMVISEAGVTIYLGYKGETFYATSNEDVAKNPTRELPENLTSSRYFDKTMPNASVALDFKKFMENPMVQMGLSSLGGDTDLKNFIQSLDYVSSVGKTDNSKTSIVLDNKEVNSLATITQLLVNLSNK